MTQPLPSTSVGIIKTIADWYEQTGNDMKTRSLGGSIEGYGHKIADYAQSLRTAATDLEPVDVDGHLIPELPAGDRLFDVSLWFPVRVKITGVEASSFQEAADLAETSIDVKEFASCVDKHLYVRSDLHPGMIIDVHGDCLDEGATEALVDAVNSEGIMTDENATVRCDSLSYPYAKLCQKLVAWNESGRPAACLLEILQEAKTVDLRIFSRE